jgi:hypothetical protein
MEEQQLAGGYLQVVGQKGRLQPIHNGCVHKTSTAIQTLHFLARSYRYRHHHASRDGAGRWAQERGTSSNRKLASQVEEKEEFNDNVLTLDPMATQTRHECINQHTVMVGLAEGCPH